MQVYILSCLWYTKFPIGIATLFSGKCNYFLQAKFGCPVIQTEMAVMTLMIVEVMKPSHDD